MLCILCSSGDSWGVPYVWLAGGSGLFGTMLADKLARSLAEGLVNQVNDILERRDEEEARALRMLENGGGGMMLCLSVRWPTCSWLRIVLLLS